MVQTAPVPPVSPVHAPFEVRLEEVFRHILRHMQGRIRTDIPASAIDAVLQACAQRAATRETITPAMVHAILRHLSRTAGRPFSDFRRHVYQITIIVRGAPLLELTIAQERQLCDAFDGVLRLHNAHKATGEWSGDLHICWFVHRLLRAFGYPAHIVDPLEAPAPSDEANLRYHRDVWHRVCIDNGWRDDASEVVGR